MKKMYISILFLVSLSFMGCSSSQTTQMDDDKNIPYETNNTLYNKRNIVPIAIDFMIDYAVHNKAAYIPSQCYTKTMEENGTAHNPCFACHTSSIAPNFINDLDLQTHYDMGEYTAKNRFTNLFKDRNNMVAQISDTEIKAYVKENNYLQKGDILLAKKLKIPPKTWDVTKDKKWDGYTPDCYFDFDSKGYDKTPKGDYTGWRAFAYTPFLGTFWPTNGSTDDVLIRLSPVFMQDENGVFNRDVYSINLSIVEALIKQKTVSIDQVDENLYGVDLNQNGTLDKANTIVFTWEQPSYDKKTGKISHFSMSYVGKAKQLLSENSYLIAPGLYPKGTEFLHSVRYIQSDENSRTVKMAPRMKELRYAKKVHWLSYSALSNVALASTKEKVDFPDRVETFKGNTEYGLSNHLGWVYQGFIEDAKGELRPQNYEETLFCMGCHSGIGATADSTFAFQRKLNDITKKHGWYHWTQNEKGYKNMPEPKTKEGKYEYTLYLQQNHAGDEFRANLALNHKFFSSDGALKPRAIQQLHRDISHLILPSKQRALELNKAYKAIVEEQSFIYGRDTHIKPLANVYDHVRVGQETNCTMVP